MNRRTLSLLLVAVLLTGGCTTAYRFQLVDAVNGRPLDGVETVAFTQGHYFGNRLFGHNEMHRFPPTSRDGVVEADGLLAEPEFTHTFQFTKDGYRGLTVLGGYTFKGWTVCSVSPGGGPQQGDMYIHSVHFPHRDSVHSEA